MRLLFVGNAASAQLTGSITGVIEDANGTYRFDLLPPGEYLVTYTLSGLGTQERTLTVLLDQATRVDVVMQPEAVTETLEVVSTSALIDTSSAELKTAIGNESIQSLPVGQEYRDLLKLIPGVQYSEDSVRGPSAGGSGQDNVFLFDGVNVGLPLFGSLASEPASHDIGQISIVKGGAKATDFNRSGGFTINSVSKSGTNAWHGMASYQIQTESMTSSRKTPDASEFEEDKDWTVLNIGGPLVQENLFFYASYYRPTENRANRSNLYGDVPDYDNTRDELFGKLTLNATDQLLFNLSYRDSDHDIRGRGVTDEDRAGTSSVGDTATQKIAIFEGNWITSQKSFLNFRYTDFDNRNSSRPDNLLGFNIAIDGSVPLDVGNLDRQGFLELPIPIAGEDEFNAFLDPLVQRYGFVENGERQGGGINGVYHTIDDQDYFRESWEIEYDYFLGTEVAHELHVGYLYSSDEEELARTSNGWGRILVPGGLVNTDDGQPIFFETRFEQQSLRDAQGIVVPPIKSELETQSIEINDTIKLDRWSFNVGFVFSNDTYFGQGLRPNSSNLSGFELAPGNRYKMYEIGFDEMIQPRLGAVWSYNDRDTVYANYARYNPAVSSLPRAASWDRNLRQTIRGFFDADGNLIASEVLRSSSGKFFQEGIDPRYIDEYLIGTSMQLSSGWTGRAHVRYRKGGNFWEDTNNTARIAYDPPPGIPREPYIPNLDEYRAEVGGSSYVIAELDGAYTKYYEASLDGEWRSRNGFFRGTYVWSHYYGNFDQDNSTTENDQNIFVGSSFIADGAGRQLWNFREGNLRGDRRHQLKFFGAYNFDWNGSAGIFGVWQSGQPWETWNVLPYRRYTTSSSDTSRYAEPAGSRTTDSHWQIDLNYTQNFEVGDRFNIQVRADLFNVFDEQTGYNIQNQFNSSNFGVPRTFFNPRRLQLAVRFLF